MMRGMEGAGFGDIFGDPEDLQRRLAEFAEQMQGNQRLAWADNAIGLAVQMTVSSIGRVNLQGDAEAQADQIRSFIARVFPEAVTLVREARAGLQYPARAPGGALAPARACGTSSAPMR